MLRSALICIALFAAAPAFAADPSHQVTVRVWRADLDLTTEDGARILLRRLAGSARETCAQIDSPLLPRARAYAYRCRRQAIERALDQLDAWQVNRTYAALLRRGGLAALER